MAHYAVTGRSCDYWVERDGVRVRGPYKGVDAAMIAMDAQQAKERALSRKERKCMTCTAPFMSDGPHHRMCGPCRAGKREFLGV